MLNQEEKKAKVMCPKSLRENILGKVGDAAQRSPLPVYTLKPPKRKIEVGSFYEVDHSKLPHRSPTQLHSIRVVMVTAKTELNVTIRYPSTQSLEAYFGNMESVALRMKLYPALDDKFVMGPKLAIEVLGRQIPSEEFAELRHSKPFWVVGCFEAEQPLSPVSVCEAGGTSESKASKAGRLFSKLQSSGIKGWGSQRVVAYLRDPKHLNGSKEGISQVRVKEEEKENQETECKEIVRQLRKRKPGRRPCAVTKTKHSPKTEPIEPKAQIRENKEGTYIERWPVKRYEAAATKLVEVLKANSAVYGNAISRFQLREEARSQIGDTGLLDHLLKHLAGKVVPGGNERLRRRCDSEGKMEYWLESADLADIRKQAGVQDPYWTPPPGWKPGDCLSAHNCVCCQEVKLLKEELSSMRRQMVELKSKNEDVQSITVALPECAAFSGRSGSHNLTITTSKEMYESLLKKKSVMEEQLVEISEVLMGLEEDMKVLSHIHKAQAAAEQKSLMLTNSNSIPGEEMNEISITGIEHNLGEEDEGEGERKTKRQRVVKMSMKLKPCGHQDNITSNIPSQAVDTPVEDLMALTPASASPLSSTTS